MGAVPGSVVADTTEVVVFGVVVEGVSTDPSTVVLVVGPVVAGAGSVAVDEPDDPPQATVVRPMPMTIAANRMWMHRPGARRP